MTSTSTMTNRANVGCGRTPTEGWLNFDNSLSARFAHSRLILSLLKAARLASQESLKFGAGALEKGIRWAGAVEPNMLFVHAGLTHSFTNTGNDGAELWILAYSDQPCDPNGTVVLYASCTAREIVKGAARLTALADSEL